MYAGHVLVYQTCMLVGTRLQNDITKMQQLLLKTWEIAGAVGTDMADGRMQM